ncbi:phage tail protein [Xenorhabdus griffiniae]|uniref:phage tail protein n=1 Tax=Xenorhabdus griffiniae TaxID=351672 RepID=UPI0030CA8B14
MSTKYFALLTRLGADKLANAAALGTKLNITHMAVGDGGGTLPTPDTAQTQLVNERRRAAINVLSVDPQNTNQIMAEQIIPENEGGWWIREIGLFDTDGILIAVGNCAETYKPQLQEGSGRTQTIRMVLIVSHTDAVTLKIDPSVVLATREYADAVVANAIREHEQSRRHPDATLQDKGFVVLSNDVSDSETMAATPKAVKAAYDLAAAANNHANSCLGKNQNGADIPDKQAFVKNLGLAGTAELAKNALPKSAITQYSGDSTTLVMSQQITTQLISQRVTRAAAELLAVPIGGILMWCSAVDYPNNFLPLDGGIYDRSKYPDLVAHYPSGQLPDWRGYVPRGWDNERGIDAGRTLGSFQGDAIRDITGVIRTGSRKMDGIPDKTTGAFSTVSTGGNIAVYGSSDKPNAYTYEDREFRASYVVPTAPENRMKNVAVIFLVRGK